MKRDDDSHELYEVIRSICESHADKPSLNPIWLATEAMTVVGFERGTNNIVWLGCHLKFRDIARAFCRRQFDPAESIQTDLFPETLQERYPRGELNADAEPEYVLRDRMTPSDVQYNVARLRKEAAAKLKHADALEAWARRRFGRLSA